MNELSFLARIFIYLGTLLLVLGVIIYFFGNSFTWLGNLPGDITVERENFRFYFPVTTMIIISVIINIVIRIIKWIL